MTVSNLTGPSSRRLDRAIFIALELAANDLTEIWLASVGTHKNYVFQQIDVFIIQTSLQKIYGDLCTITSVNWELRDQTANGYLGTIS